MMEPSEKELLENSKLELREKVKKAEELEALFELAMKSMKYVTIQLKNAPEDKTIYNLRYYLEHTNHLAILDEGTWYLANGNSFEDEYVNKLLSESCQSIKKERLNMTIQIKDIERGDTDKAPTSTNAKRQSLPKMHKADIMKYFAGIPDIKKELPKKSQTPSSRWKVPEGKVWLDFDKAHPGCATEKTVKKYLKIYHSKL